MRLIILVVAVVAVLLVIFGYDWIMKIAEKRQSKKLDTVKDEVEQYNKIVSEMEEIKNKINQK